MLHDVQNVGRIRSRPISSITPSTIIRDGTTTANKLITTHLNTPYQADHHGILMPPRRLCCTAGSGCDGEGEHGILSHSGGEGI